MNVSPQSSLLKLFSNEVTRAFLTFIHLFIYSFFFFSFFPYSIRRRMPHNDLGNLNKPKVKYRRCLKGVKEAICASL